MKFQKGFLCSSSTAYVLIILGLSSLVLILEAPEPAMPASAAPRITSREAPLTPPRSSHRQLASTSILKSSLYSDGTESYSCRCSPKHQIEVISSTFESGGGRCTLEDPRSGEPFIDLFDIADVCHNLKWTAAALESTIYWYDQSSTHVQIECVILDEIHSCRPRYHFYMMDVYDNPEETDPTKLIISTASFRMTDYTKEFDGLVSDGWHKDILDQQTFVSHAHSGCTTASNGATLCSVVKRAFSPLNVFTDDDCFMWPSDYASNFTHGGHVLATGWCHRAHAGTSSRLLQCRAGGICDNTPADFSSPQDRANCVFKLKDYSKCFKVEDPDCSIDAKWCTLQDSHLPDIEEYSDMNHTASVTKEDLSKMFYVTRVWAQAMQKWLHFYSFEYDDNGMACKTFTSFDYALVNPNLQLPANWVSCPVDSGRVLCHQATDWTAQQESWNRVTGLGCWFEHDVDNCWAKRMVKHVPLDNSGCWTRKTADDTEFLAAPAYSPYSDKNDPACKIDAAGLGRSCHFSKTHLLPSTGEQIPMVEQLCTHVLDDASKCLSNQADGYCKIKTPYSCTTYQLSAHSAWTKADGYVAKYRFRSAVLWNYLLGMLFNTYQISETKSSWLKDFWWMTTLYMQLHHNFFLTTYTHPPHRCYSYAGVGTCAGDWRACGSELQLSLEAPMNREPQTGDYCITIADSFIEISDLSHAKNSFHVYHHPDGVWHAMFLCWHKLFLPGLSLDDPFMMLLSDRGGVALHKLRNSNTHINYAVVKLLYALFTWLGVNLDMNVSQ